jgi:hypothetical protein
MSKICAAKSIRGAGSPMANHALTSVDYSNLRRLDCKGQMSMIGAMFGRKRTAKRGMFQKWTLMDADWRQDQAMGQTKPTAGLPDGK